ATLRVPVLRDLCELLGRDGTGIAHEGLVDRAELVDAKRDIADRAAGPALLLPGEKKALQDLLERGISDPHLIDEVSATRVEKVGLEALEEESAFTVLRGNTVIDFCVRLRRCFTVPRVHQAEQLLERVV